MEKSTDTEPSEENRRLERADLGLPQQWPQCQSLVRRKWYQHRQLLQMAKEAVFPRSTKRTAVC